MKRCGFLFLFLLIFCTNLFAENDSVPKKLRKNPLSLELAYKGDVAGNAVGGIKRGVGYLGYLSVALHFSTENAGWWRGGELCIGGGNTHGSTPSASWLGDFQIADNIEAGNHTFLEQLWFRQSFWHMSVTVGLQDLNADYAVCEAAGDFFNSSFGIHSTLSTHFAAPIFPITGLGLNWRWDINERWAWQAAVYDGSPLGFDENPYNVKWRLSKEKGFLTITEGQFLPTIAEKLNGAYKLGAYYHTSKAIFGLYLSAEQQCLATERHDLTAFLQAAVAPQFKHHNQAHLAAGVNLEGVFSKKKRDKMGLAFTTAFMECGTHETAIEWFYKYQLLKQLYLQPDVQYIVHPSGGEVLKNALFLALRVGVNF